MTRDETEPIRRRELAEQQAPTNEAFSAYVTTTAFSLSLSRHMVQALSTIEHALAWKREYTRVHVHETNRNALVRRGLIVLIGDPIERFDGEQLRRWDEVYALTRAGELMIDLLAEAQLVAPRALRHPLPPPPPGWLDPRPKLCMKLNGPVTVEPSDREREYPQ